MSPFRVIAKTEGGTTRLLSAMRSPDESTGLNRIFIVEKPISKEIRNELTLELVKELAHIPMGKKNSQILAQYHIYEYEDGKYYGIIEDQINKDKTRTLKVKERVMSDCLKAAMFDFCSRRHLTVSTMI